MGNKGIKSDSHNHAHFQGFGVFHPVRNLPLLKAKGKYKYYHVSIWWKLPIMIIISYRCKLIYEILEIHKYTDVCTLQLLIFLKNQNHKFETSYAIMKYN